MTGTEGSMANTGDGMTSKQFAIAGIRGIMRIQNTQCITNGVAMKDGVITSLVVMKDEAISPVEMKDVAISLVVMKDEVISLVATKDAETNPSPVVMKDEAISLVATKDAETNPSPVETKGVVISPSLVAMKDAVTSNMETKGTRIRGIDKLAPDKSIIICGLLFHSYNEGRNN